MQITLISPYLDITSLSTRALGSFLKREGHRVRQIFLPDLECLLEHDTDFAVPYHPDIVGQVVELCRGSGLIGITLMTNYFLKSRQLTRAVQEQTGIPVIWGGVHPTIEPRASAEVADYVCVGEGEEALAELIQHLEDGSPADETANIGYLEKGRYTLNPPRPLIQDLDTLPHPDYDLKDQFVLVGRKVVPLEDDLLVEMSRGRVNFPEPESVIYETMWTRGCPYHCTFCINNALIELYSGQKLVRRRSVGHLMEELEAITSRFPAFNRVNFADDCFIFGSLEELSAFRERYKETVGFPFFCLLSVQSVKEEKLTLLFDAGLSRLEIGIQSAAPRTNTVFRREYFTPDKLVACGELINRLKPDHVVPTYDVILENPYERPEDVLVTLRAVLRLPRPFLLQLWSLTFFPGTELYQRALEDGLISGPEEAFLKDDRHRGISYLNLLFLLVNRGIPGWLISILAWHPLVRLLESRFFRLLFSMANRPYWAVKRRRARSDRKRQFGPLIVRFQNHRPA